MSDRSHLWVRLRWVYAAAFLCLGLLFGIGKQIWLGMFLYSLAAVINVLLALRGRQVLRQREAASKLSHNPD